MKKLLIALLTIGYAFSINGTITFYDGTNLKGELSSSDTRYVFIIPDGLVMPEKIPVVDIELLKLEIGILLIEDGLAQQTYMDGKFSLIERQEPKEISIVASEDDYEDYSLGNLDYFSTSVFYGMPVYFRPSLQSDDGKNPTSLPNLGVSFSLPYFPIGPINMSMGGRIITLGFDPSLVQRTIATVDRNEYKRRQAAPGIKITPRNFGRDRRMPISNQYQPYNFLLDLRKI